MQTKAPTKGDKAAAITSSSPLMVQRTSTNPNGPESSLLDVPISDPTTRAKPSVDAAGTPPMKPATASIERTRCSTCGKASCGCMASRSTPALNGGTRLSHALATKLQPSTSIDLSKVRVHAGPEASAAAEAMEARAYAFGQHVVFGEGQFRPGTASGDSLLAHELTHLEQQAVDGPRIQRSPDPHPK